MENLLSKIKEVKDKLVNLSGAEDSIEILNEIISNLESEEGHQAASYIMKPPLMTPPKK